MPRPEFYQLPGLRKCVGLLLVGLNFAAVIWGCMPIQLELRRDELHSLGMPVYFAGSFARDVICLILLAAVSSLLLFGAYYFATEKSGGTAKRICLFLIFSFLYICLDAFLFALIASAMVV